MKVERYYLEINSLQNLKIVDSPNQKLLLEKVDPPNIEINKFFYKNIGKNHRWIDRLVWDNLKWTSYLNNKNVHTYVLKLDKEFVGYFEVISDQSTNSSEIAYFGILDNYIEKKFGGFMLSEAIKKCFELYSKRVWVHTCTLDHKNALKNYINRGMKIFKEENINLNLD
ncbi:GNAT family N-acetyltransferase [Candidatus Pelagibacter sp.]|nr:GNAT family N-acetyltransferase [Candidatus Pelagibacter sp.]